MPRLFALLSCIDWGMSAPSQEGRLLSGLWHAVTDRWDALRARGVRNFWVDRCAGIRDGSHQYDAGECYDGTAARVSPLTFMHSGPQGECDKAAVVAGLSFRVAFEDRIRKIKAQGGEAIAYIGSLPRFWNPSETTFAAAVGPAVRAGFSVGLDTLTVLKHGSSPNDALVDWLRVQGVKVYGEPHDKRTPTNRHWFDGRLAGVASTVARAQHVMTAGEPWVTPGTLASESLVLIDGNTRPEIRLDMARTMKAQGWSAVIEFGGMSDTHINQLVGLFQPSAHAEPATGDAA